MSDIISSTDNYLSLLLSSTHVSPIGALLAFILTLSRIVPILVLAPFLGARALPAPVKIMFSISLCAIFLPHIIISLPEDISFGIPYAILLIKEIVIGFILGFLVTIPFYIAQSSGSLIDHIRGSSSLQVTDPTTSTQTGPVGILYNYVLIAVFFIVDGPFYFFDAVNKSFQLIPIYDIVNPAFFSANIPFWKMILELVSYILGMAIQLGAPSIIGILMAEMFLGIANRLAPQVQIVFLGISLKSWVGLGLLAAAWYFIMNQLGKESLAWVRVLEKTLAQTIVK